MHGFAPLSADPAVQRDDAGRRLRLIADAYGLTERQRHDIIPLLARRTRAMHAFLAARGRPRHPAVGAAVARGSRRHLGR